MKRSSRKLNLSVNQDTLTSEFHLSVYEVDGIYTAIISDLDFKFVRKHLADDVFDVARLVADHASRNHEIPPANLKVVLHFPPSATRAEDRFHEMKISVKQPAEPRSVTTSGHMLVIPPERLVALIGEEYSRP